MNDILGYNERMRATMEDKMWFVSHLPENIDTIIDFGCADCSLAKAIDEKYPNRFKMYYGIDESADMLNTAKQNLCEAQTKLPVTLLSSLDEIDQYKEFVPQNTVFVLNSVIHEIYNYNNDAYSADAEYYGSYSRCKYFDDLMRTVDELDISYIAIRDMFAQLEKIFDAFKQVSILRGSKAKDLFSEYEDYFNKHWRGLAHDFMYVSNYVVYDFLMKWFYTDNWDREMKEFYFWNWLDGLLKDEQYPIKHIEYFQIPYVVEKAKELGIDMTWNTHVKLLLTRGTK